VTWPKVLAVERALIASRFRGSRQSYLAALARAHVSLSLARGILADELRRSQLAHKLRVPRPTAGAIRTFYESYPDMLVRAVTAKPAPTWLSGESKGFAVEAISPSGVFALASKTTRTLRTMEGTFEVRAVGAAQPLGTMPLSIVAP